MGILPQTLAFPFRTGREGRMRVLLWALRRSNAHPSFTGREGGVGISVRTCLPPSLNLYRRETEHAV
jgi:hypothetical protein